LRKSVLALYAVLAAVITGAFFSFSSRLETGARSLLINNFSPFEVDKKILIVSGQMHLELYNALLKKAAQADNSVMIMLPQLYNIKFDYYLDDMNPDAAVNAKRAYSELAETLAESDRLLPVVYVGREGGKDKGDISSQAFSDDKPGGVNPPRFTDARSYAVRMFKTTRAATFFMNYTSYPASVPMVFSYEGKYFLSAPAEAVRRYYKFIKGKITFGNGIMKAGDAMRVPVDGSGHLLIPPLLKAPETVTPQEVLLTPATLLENRIIIARGLSQPQETLDALAAAISCILNSRALSSSPLADLIAALVVAALIAANYRSGRWQLFSIALLLIGAVWGVSIWLSTMAIVSAPVTQTFAALFTLYTVIYFRSAKKSRDIQARFAALVKHMDRHTARRMVKKNRDIMLINSEKKAWLISILCPPESTKKTFEKALTCLYNGKNDYLAVINGDGSITAAVFEAENVKPQSAVNAALCIKEAGFPVLLRRETVKVNNEDGAYMLSGGSREMLAGFMKLVSGTGSQIGVNARANVYVPGRDIQDYIGITKFQKANASGEEFFAVTGQREEAQ